MALIELIDIDDEHAADAMERASASLEKLAMMVDLTRLFILQYMLTGENVDRKTLISHLFLGISTLFLIFLGLIIDEVILINASNMLDLIALKFYHLYDVGIVISYIYIYFKIQKKYS